MIAFIGIGSGLGRFITGWMGDRVSPLLLYALSVLLIGVADIVLPFLTSYTAMAAAALAFGWGGGSFIALLAVMLANWLGVSRLPQALGMCYSTQAITLMLGPPLVGWLYDALGSYTIPLVLVGVAEFLSAAAMCYVPTLERKQQEAEREAAAKEAEQKGAGTAP